MRNNCFRSNGTPRTITGTRFTTLAPRRIRWELFADGNVLNHSEVIDLAELPSVLEISRMLLVETAGITGDGPF